MEALGPGAADSNRKVSLYGEKVKPSSRMPRRGRGRRQTGIRQGLAVGYCGGSGGRVSTGQWVGWGLGWGRSGSRGRVKMELVDVARARWAVG